MAKNDILNQNLTLDGGMGSLLIERASLPAGYMGEKLCLERPDVVSGIHADYAAAGADVIYTNTFGANAFKAGSRAASDELIAAAVRLARGAKRRYCALDFGPLGKILGSGGLSFEDALSEYAAMIRAGDDRTDFIVLETLTDLKELRAGLLAAKENSALPVMASMSFEPDGRTFFGVSVASFVLTAEGLGADAVGINCSLGPIEMLPVVKELLKYATVPVFVKPNAGMPKLVDGRTVYDIGEDAFFGAVAAMKELGVNILGGCCGTTPSYIRRIASLKDKTCPRVLPAPASYLCCAARAVEVTGTKIVGERINPTGKPRFKEALRAGDVDYIAAQGISQQGEGADVLDVNVGINDVDEKDMMLRVLERVQTAVSLPLCIDSSDPAVLEAALRVYHGKALVNSVSGKRSSLDAVLPLVKKYGAAVVGLCLDEGGIPGSVDGRVEIAKKIIAEAERYGIPKRDIYIDTLTMAEASGRGNAMLTLGALSQIKALGAKSILGVSNISFGMPNRPDINAKFLELARGAGLDLCIINPSLKNIVGSEEAAAFLRGEEGAAERYIAYATKVESVTVKAEDLTLESAILTGATASAARLATELLKSAPPMEVAAKHIIPALDKIGALYESGKIFLPQLIASADAAKEAFAYVSAAITDSGGGDSGKRLVLCTVKGDIHDIGKNIVKAVVLSYGYRVIDLGRDVDYDDVTEAVRQNWPCVLGLSALMTTTAVNMAETIRRVREAFPTVPVLVGGAVLTREYAEKIGGIYCLDAADTVKRLKELDAFFSAEPQ